MADEQSTGAKFERTVKIMERLRAPGGCPWDREQTFDTIKPYTLEETYEVFEAIENRDWQELPAELGDLLLQVLFYAEMAREAGHFTINDVLDRLSTKLVDRHPHVFGDVEAKTAHEVVKNWERLKKEEQSKRSAGTQAKNGDAEAVLKGISRAMPALLEATKISKRAAGIGFEWPTIDDLFEKLDEEVLELRENIAQLPAPPSPGKATAGAQGHKVPDHLQSRIEDEVGDLFFTVVNIARYLNVDPEQALRGTNKKFRERFESMEAEAQKDHKRLEELSLEEMEELWQKSKTGAAQK
ncbi:MAG TPA: nucleoside triphosphate pyrophosphohydrolase [Terriglobales bacterium]